MSCDVLCAEFPRGWVHTFTFLPMPSSSFLFIFSLSIVPIHSTLFIAPFFTGAQEYNSTHTSRWSFVALVLSQLDYCCSSQYRMRQQCTAHFQDTALRAHWEALFSLHWLCVQERILLEITVMTYALCTGSALASLAYAYVYLWSYFTRVTDVPSRTWFAPVQLWAWLVLWATLKLPMRWWWWWWWYKHTDIHRKRPK